MKNPSLIESIVVQIYPESPTLALPSKLRVSIVPVTREQYKSVCFDQPAGLSHPIFPGHPWKWVPYSENLPATGISYLEAVAWLKALNHYERRTGDRQWRLPSSPQEWEAICRAGRGESGHEWWTRADRAKEGWFTLDGVGIPPVRMRRPSPAGLYDLWTIRTWLSEPEGEASARQIGHDWHDDMPQAPFPQVGPTAPQTEQSPFVGLRLVCDDIGETGGLSERNWSLTSRASVAEAVGRERRWPRCSPEELAQLRGEVA